MKRTACIVFSLCWLNGCAFFVHTSVVGGGASIGRIENGKYYVGSHGRYTEVSRSTYRCCWWHELSFAATTLIALFIGLDQALSRKRRNQAL